MEIDKTVEYLIVGGLRSGEVWVGDWTTDPIKIKSAKEDKRLPKMYSRDTEAEITTPLDDSYFVKEHHAKDGNKYMVAFSETLDGYNVDEMISQVSPPLTPVK